MRQTVIHQGEEWTPALIRERIRTNDAVLKRALLRLYSFQTDDEKWTGSTQDRNGAGFNGVDSEILSSFAVQLSTRGWLSPKQLSVARKLLPKYAQQLFRYAQATRS
jgi:hypothetical protein